MRRITISLPDALADKAQRAVSAGDADSVSAYFARAVAREPDWVLAQEALDELYSGSGPIQADALARARDAMDLTEDGEPREGMPSDSAAGQQRGLIAA